MNERTMRAGVNSPFKNGHMSISVNQAKFVTLNARELFAGIQRYEFGDQVTTPPGHGFDHHD